MITAHSGSDGYQDNSQAFIEAMLESEVEAIEIDCQLSEDQTLYLSHDEVEDHTACLTLDEVFEWMKHSDNQDIVINVDCKNIAAGPLVVELAKSYGILERVVLSGSLRVEDYEASYRGQLFYNLENRISMEQVADLEVLERVLAELSAEQIKIVQANYRFVNSGNVALVRQYGLELSVWTVNDLDLIDELLAMGCYNVTSRSALSYLNTK